jgi:hypothetical protein
MQTYQLQRVGPTTRELIGPPERNQRERSGNVTSCREIVSTLGLFWLHFHQESSQARKKEMKVHSNWMQKQKVLYISFELKMININLEHNMKRFSVEVDPKHFCRS